MAFLIILLVFSLFPLLPVNIGFSFDKKPNYENMIISMEFLRIVKLRFKMSKMILILNNIINYIWTSDDKDLKSRKEKLYILSQSFKKAIYTIKNISKKFIRTTKFLLKSINIKKLKLRLKLGSGNPFFTGIISGQAWSIIYFFIGHFSKKLDFDEANLDIEVSPAFDHGRLWEMSFDSIFNVRIGHIIIVGFCMLYYLALLNRSKITGSENLWTGIQSKV